MSIKKQYLKRTPLCKVTFRLSKKQAKSAKTVHLVGEFNRWNVSSTPMRKLRKGAFHAVIDLEKGREYQFRYLLDGTEWINESNADRYVPTPYEDASNSVVVV